MRKLSYFFAIIVTGLICYPALANFQAGVDAYKKGDFSTAIRELKPYALQGDAQSQWLLGSSYSNVNTPDKPQPQQFQNALKWLKLAAEQGHVGAMLDIGRLYMFYQDKADVLKAKPWFQRAAEYNDAEAQFLLGLLYFSGDVIPKDYVKAYMWWILAAKKGHPLAKQMLRKSLDVITTDEKSEAEQLAKEWEANKKSSL